MGHNAGWPSVVERTPDQVASALEANLTARGAVLLGRDFASVERARRCTSWRGFAICRERTDDAATFFDSFEDGYTPDPALALALAHRLDTAIVVSLVCDAGGGWARGVVGPRSEVVRVPSFDASQDGNFFHPMGELAFRNFDAEDERRLTFLAFDCSALADASSEGEVFENFFHISDRGSPGGEEPGDRVLLVYTFGEDEED